MENCWEFCFFLGKLRMVWSFITIKWTNNHQDHWELCIFDHVYWIRIQPHMESQHPYYRWNNTEESLQEPTLRCSSRHANHRECVRSVYSMLLFSPSNRFFLQKWSIGWALGGWWLSLNDPVYFEKALISVSAFLNSNKEGSKPILAPP